MYENIAGRRDGGVGDWACTTCGKAGEEAYVIVACLRSGGGGKDTVEYAGTWDEVVGGCSLGILGKLFNLVWERLRIGTRSSDKLVLLVSFSFFVVCASEMDGRLTYCVWGGDSVGSEITISGVCLVSEMPVGVKGRVLLKSGCDQEPALKGVRSMLRLESVAPVRIPGMSAAGTGWKGVLCV